jgi:hypothetical protein
MEGLFSEKVTMKQVAAPADLDGAAVTGARIKLDKGFKLAIVCSFGDSTAAVTDFTLQQHDAASSGNSKALAVQNHYYHKVASASVFTKVELSSAASNIVPTVLAADEGIIVLEVTAGDLDRDNDYAWVSVNVADSTAAKLMSALYIVHDVKETPAYELAV